eukprot:TRINITY_DN5279_c0_g1_i1.p1 TRINITY_DN5279_c0_g1~~TRINITY_DN5279_c0_g1_i1.p1  ORF type:complete len:150 (+),score=11.39 TRINITY_DN5279_c0_g1_i1:3-452(+)
MKFITAFLFLLVPSLVFGEFAESFKWEQCNPTLINLTQATMSPDPAIPGKTVTFTATGNLTADILITGGTWTGIAYLGGVAVETFSGPVCEIIISCDCPCQGPKEATAQISFPCSLATPRGATIVANMTAVDQTGVQFFCISTSFRVAE